MISSDFLSSVFLRNADRPAIITSERTHSYDDCRKITLKISSELADLDATKPVAIWGSNSAQYLLSLTALWNLQIPAFPLNTRLPKDQLTILLKRAGCDTALLPLPDSIDLDVQTIRQINGRGNSVPNAAFFENLSGEEHATYLATSGSSGTPKIAVHTLANHYYSALGSNENIALRPGDSWLLSLPLYHVGGIAIWMRCLLAGATVSIPDKGQSLEQALINLPTTHLSLVSTQLLRLMESDSGLAALQKLKAVLLGGSAIPKPLLRRAIEAGLPIHTSYGSTEMSSQIATTPPEGVNVVFSSGKVLPYCELKIADDGEIMVRGKTLFSGYLHNGAVKNSVDTQGWFHTRDCGRLDDSGNLHITGRMDNMFISGGENIQPEEVERALEQIPGVLSAIVVAVADDEFGHRPVAFIRLQNSASYFDESQLKALLRKQLAGYKIPRRILPWPEQSEPGDHKIKRSVFLKFATDNLSI